MNKPVSLELKQLLYNKGWRYELSDDISETGSLYNNHSLAEERFNQNDISYVDITISDIIMWLYDKHNIYIHISPHGDDETSFKECKWWFTVYKDYVYNLQGGSKITSDIGEFNSIQEAYIKAIKYCLNNKI